MMTKQFLDGQTEKSIKAHLRMDTWKDMADCIWREEKASILESFREISKLAMEKWRQKPENMKGHSNLGKCMATVDSNGTMERFTKGNSTEESYMEMEQFSIPMAKWWRASGKEEKTNTWTASQSGKAKLKFD